MGYSRNSSLSARKTQAFVKGSGKVSRTTWLLIIFASLLIAIGLGGSAYAALGTFSQAFTARVATSDIGVTLLENGTPVAWQNYVDDGVWDGRSGTLLGSLVAEGEALKPGMVYPEEISVENSGTISQYVRLILRRYWISPGGEKMQSLSPALIELGLINDGSWILDENASTDERLVFYSAVSLAPGEQSDPLVTSVTVDPVVSQKVIEQVDEQDGLTTISTTYDYDGTSMCLEACVDAVQSHNVVDAALSAWGVSLTLRDGRIDLA